VDAAQRGSYLFEICIPTNYDIYFEIDNTIIMITNYNNKSHVRTNRILDIQYVTVYLRVMYKPFDQQIVK